MSVIPTINYDTRYGWFRFDRRDRVQSIRGEPFESREQAISYALEQLSRGDSSMYSMITNAKKALEWAASANLCPGDSSLCYVAKGTADAHYRCGTSACGRKDTQ